MRKYLIFILIFLVPFFASAQTFERDLRFGLQGNSDVTKLQEFLADRGLYSGPITGNFFSLTLKAVKNFQTRENIKPASGYFGLKTRTKANSILAASVSKSENQANTENVTPPVAISTTPTKTENDKPNAMALMMDQIASLQKQLELLLKKTPTPPTPTVPPTQTAIISNQTPVVTQPTPQITPPTAQIPNNITNNAPPTTTQTTVNPQTQQQIATTQPIQQQVIQQQTVQQQPQPPTSTQATQAIQPNQVIIPAPTVSSFLILENIMLPRYSLKWGTKNTKNCFLKDSLNSLHPTKNEIEVDVNRTGMEVNPKELDTYTLRCIGDGGEVTKSITLQNRAIALTKDNTVVSLQKNNDIYFDNGATITQPSFRLDFKIPIGIAGVLGARGYIKSIKFTIISELESGYYSRLEVENKRGYGNPGVYVATMAEQLTILPPNHYEARLIEKSGSGFNSSCNSSLDEGAANVWCPENSYIISAVGPKESKGRIKLRVESIIIKDLFFDNDFEFFTQPIESDWVQQ